MIKFTKKCKMAENHFCGVLGGVFLLRGGLKILIGAPDVPFLVPPKKGPKYQAVFLVFWIQNHRPDQIYEYTSLK